MKDDNHDDARMRGVVYNYLRDGWGRMGQTRAVVEDEEGRGRSQVSVAVIKEPYTQPSPAPARWVLPMPCRRRTHVSVWDGVAPYEVRIELLWTLSFESEAKQLSKTQPKPGDSSARYRFHTVARCPAAQSSASPKIRNDHRIGQKAGGFPPFSFDGCATSASALSTLGTALSHKEMNAASAGTGAALTRVTPAKLFRAQPAGGRGRAAGPKRRGVSGARAAPTVVAAQQEDEFAIFRFTLGIPGFEDDDIPRVVGFLGASLLVVNHLASSNPSDAQVSDSSDSGN